MDKIISVVNDLVVIIFDLLIFTKMVSLKRDTLVHRIVMYGGCGVIILAYFVMAYVYGYPSSVASVVCMSIPSLVLFFILSKHKDCRFLMTFCFVDSLSLIIVFIGRWLGMVAGQNAGIISITVTVMIFTGIVFFGNKHFKRYTELLEVVKTGWGIMTAATVVSYFALVFIAAYPIPLAKRVEYGLPYLALCAVVIFSYIAFLQSIVKSNKILEQYRQLQKEKIIHKIAYLDSLTGIHNRYSYIQRINEIERSRNEISCICCIMFDLNDLKIINDTKGHHMGDQILQAVAGALEKVFSSDVPSVFRIGGDEFAVICCGEPEEAQQKIEEVYAELKTKSQDLGIPISLASGLGVLRGHSEDSIEEIFIYADRNMYMDKKERKAR